MECNQKQLEKSCKCTYLGCSRRGKCCECINYHLGRNELPGCAFAKISEDAERTYNRSFEYFARIVLK
ncbi:MAG: DUF6485 family protein [Promethearchaeia archaeon]